MIATHLYPVMIIVAYAVMPPLDPKLSSVFPIHFGAPEFLVVDIHFLFSKQTK